MKTPSLVNSSQQPVRHIGGLERVVVIATFAILTTGGDSDYIIAAKSGDLQTPQWGVPKILFLFPAGLGATEAPGISPNGGLVNLASSKGVPCMKKGNNGFLKILLAIISFILYYGNHPVQ